MGGTYGGVGGCHSGGVMLVTSQALSQHRATAQMGHGAMEAFVGLRDA